LAFVFLSSWNGFEFGFTFLFYAAAATLVRLRLRNGSYTSPFTHKLCSNTASFLAVATMANRLAHVPLLSGTTGR
jgi:hypothetical protein